MKVLVVPNAIPRTPYSRPSSFVKDPTFTGICINSLFLWILNNAVEFGIEELLL